MQVIVCNIDGDECEKSEVNKYLNIIDSKKIKQISKYKFSFDKSRSIIAHLMIWYYVENCKRNLDYKYSINGRPMLSNPNKYFSISHSGKYISIAYDAKNIGVDIEKIQEVDIAMVNIFCSDDEKQQLVQTNFDNDIIFTLWTLKEAYCKYTSKGIDESIKHTEFVNTNKNEFCLKNGDLWFKKYIIDDYIMSVCSSERITCDFQMINVKKLLSCIKEKLEEEK